MDWRVTNQKKWLQNKQLYKGFIPSKSEEHVHCCFCWEKLIYNQNNLEPWYSTLDGKWCICEKCYYDFYNEFSWSLYNIKNSNGKSLYELLYYNIDSYMCLNEYLIENLSFFLNVHCGVNTVGTVYVFPKLLTLTGFYNRQPHFEVESREDLAQTVDSCDSLNEYIRNIEEKLLPNSKQKIVISIHSTNINA